MVVLYDVNPRDTCYMQCIDLVFGNSPEVNHSRRVVAYRPYFQLDILIFLVKRAVPCPCIWVDVYKLVVGSLS